jgi:hypothetical protein
MIFFLLQLWKSSAEFCAMRSLSIVSLAQRMITLSRSCTNASRYWVISSSVHFYFLWVHILHSVRGIFHFVSWNVAEKKLCTQKTLQKKVPKSQTYLGSFLAYLYCASNNHGFSSSTHDHRLFGNYYIV